MASFVSKSSHLGGKNFKITLWSVCISVYQTPITRESSRVPLMSGNDKKNSYSNVRILYRPIKIVEVILLIQAVWSLKRKTAIYVRSVSPDELYHIFTGKLLSPFFHSRLASNAFYTIPKEAITIFDKIAAKVGGHMWVLKLLWNKNTAFLSFL